MKILRWFGLPGAQHHQARPPSSAAGSDPNTLKAGPANLWPIVISILIALSAVAVYTQPTSLIDPTFNAQAALIDTLEFSESLNFTTNGTHSHYTVALSSSPGYVNVSHDAGGDTLLNVSTRNVQSITIDVQSLFLDERTRAFVGSDAAMSWLETWLTTNAVYTVILDTDDLASVTFANLGRSPVGASWNDADLDFTVAGTSISGSVPDNGLDTLKVYFDAGLYRSETTFKATISPCVGWGLYGIPIDDSWLATDLMNDTGAKVVAVLRNGSYVRYHRYLSTYAENFYIHPRDAVMLYNVTNWVNYTGSGVFSTSTLHTRSWNGLTYTGAATNATTFMSAYNVRTVAKLSEGKWLAYRRLSGENNFVIQYGDTLIFFPSAAGTLEVSG